jgi:hypothetical protein
MAKHIFCDEAGSTGPNLLDPTQPFFAYASVAIEPRDAEALVGGLAKTYRPQGNELKGRMLVSSSRGRKLVTALLKECGAQAKVSVWEKRFALATQFFEHVFEPVLAEQNSLFYRIGFHQFISNLLYVSFVANTQRAVATMQAFQRIVRARGEEPIEQLFRDDGALLASEDELHEVEAFVLCHREKIADYVDTKDETDPMYRWSLDASMSALWSLLISWSEVLDPEPLIVSCDESRPLYDVRDRFDIMIGRADRPKVWFPSGPHSPVFNLAEPLRFVRSHEHPGIQIADVVAAASVHAFRNLKETHSREWIQLLGEGLHAIFPDPEAIDLRTRSGAINAVVLKELVARSVRQDDLFSGMGEFIEIAHSSFPGYLAGLPNDS